MKTKRGRQPSDASIRRARRRGPVRPAAALNVAVVLAATASCGVLDRSEGIDSSAATLGGSSSGGSTSSLDSAPGEDELDSGDSGGQMRYDVGGAEGAGCVGDDRDGDGFSDQTEDAAQTNPEDPSSTPATATHAVFVTPYLGPPAPPARPVHAPTELRRADVVVLMDTTGSMAGTTARIGGHIQSTVTQLAATIDDVAIGLAGYGDFPIDDGANSHYDRPFYVPHRVMTATTPAGLASLIAASSDRNIIADGLGPHFSNMRGGDEPEQGWEALRQVATGVGLTYPNAWGNPTTLPAFDPDASLPAVVPAGEEVGERGGVGLREDALPIVIMITDTEHHAASYPGTAPPSADRDVALDALRSIGARVIGLMAWQVDGHDDLAWIAEQTGATVEPRAWGEGPDRPANCPADRCCTVADDPDDFDVELQPEPVAGRCPLVFRADRYDTGLTAMMTQAVTAVAHGSPFEISAIAEDEPGDEVNAVEAFIQEIRAVPGDEPCAGLAASDTDGDGVLDTFDEVIPGASVCFEVVVADNTQVPPADQPRVFEATLRLVGDGVRAFPAVPLRFVVPAEHCPTPAG